MRLQTMVVLSLLLLVFDVAGASLSEADDEQRLLFSCFDDDECSLTPVPTGEEMITGTVTQASPVTPQTVILEFLMMAPQEQVVLLPENYEILEIDLKMVSNAGGEWRPELDATIIIGNTNTLVSFEGSQTPSPSVEPYRVEDGALNLGDQRILWPGDDVRIILELTIESPGDWEIRLRGSTFFELDIAWSEDMNSRNVDEPSSYAAPVESFLSDFHEGALLENDRDCWKFEVDDHEIMSIIIDWDEVPTEIAQKHNQFDLYMADGKQARSPDVITESEDSVVRVKMQWRDLPLGSYTFCLAGESGSFQPYSWIGQLSYEVLGSTDPGGFDGDVMYPAGAVLIGDISQSEEISSSGHSILLLLAILLLLGLVIELRHQTTSMGLRLGLFVPGILLIILGGILQPLWSIAGEVQQDDESTLDDLISARLQQLWDVSHPDTPESTYAVHSGSTWGIMDGGTLRLRMEVDAAYPLEDGRWQLHSTEFDGLDLEQIIFSAARDNGASTTADGLLDEHTVNFILLAGRAIVLDLIMLESLLIVDKVPDSSVVHLDLDMVKTKAAGPSTAPIWATRPSDISESDWTGFQQALYPLKRVFSLCDCTLDVLQTDIQFSDPPNSFETPSSSGVKPVNGLVESFRVIFIFGVIASIAAITLERLRRRTARNLFQEIVISKWN
jgi:hypothetical protein